MRIAFVTNFCPHYRVRTFEILARRHDVDYFFFSEGKEWYWERANRARAGAFKFEYLPGFHVGHVRITPTLPLKLLQGNYEAVIKCINGKLALPATFLVTRLLGKPFILWTGIWMRLRTPVHRLLFPILRGVYLHSDAIVAYGDHVKQYLIDEGVAADRIFVARQAVDNVACSRPFADVEREELRKKLEVAPGRKIVLYVGRLEEAKGIPVLLDAMMQLDRMDAVLVLAGSGSYADQVRRWMAPVHLKDRVRLVGHVPPEETPLWYSAAWVCVLPSVTTAAFKEPWGLVVNEAFNQGVPVIASDAVGAVAGGLLRDGVNGVVVREGDASDLAAALARLLDDEVLRDRLGANALTEIAAWDQEEMAMGFLEALAHVVPGANSLGNPRSEVLEP